MVGVILLWLRTWAHLLWNARRTAVVLDDCTRALGQMNHTIHIHGVMTMSLETRADVIRQAHAVLPKKNWRRLFVSIQKEDRQ